MPRRKSHSQWGLCGQGDAIYLSWLFHTCWGFRVQGIKFVLARHLTFAKLVYCIKPQWPSKARKESITNHQKYISILSSRIYGALMDILGYLSFQQQLKHLCLFLTVKGLSITELQGSQPGLELEKRGVLVPVFFHFLLSLFFFCLFLFLFENPKQNIRRMYLSLGSLYRDGCG